VIAKHYIPVLYLRIVEYLPRWPYKKAGRVNGGGRGPTSWHFHTPRLIPFGFVVVHWLFHLWVVIHYSSRSQQK